MAMKIRMGPPKLELFLSYPSVDHFKISKPSKIVNFFAPRPPLSKNSTKKHRASAFDYNLGMSDLVDAFAAEFPIPSNTILMNSAGISPMPRSAEASITEMLRKLQQEIHFDHVGVFQIADHCRSNLAKLINCSHERVALTANCASAISMVAFGIQFKKGEKILFWDQEYPSNAFPWVEAARRSNAEVEVLKSHENLDLDHQKLIEKIKPGVRVVALSWVQFQSGVTSPLKEISAACRKVGAWLVVDVIQGLGVVPFDFKESGVHAACGGSHKWLSGPLGSGFLALSDELFENIDPILVGANTFNAIGNPFEIAAAWHPDARRFEPGAPAVLNLAGWSSSIELYLKTGIDRIHKKALSLSLSICEGVSEKGFHVLGTSDLNKRQSPIVTFRAKNDSLRDKTYAALKSLKVAYSPRGGGIRLSPHAFNTNEEVSRILEIL
jgi:cysteine desulfurase/selenocysteine lyase